MFSISSLILFSVYLLRLICLTKAGQNVIDAMLESKLRLNQYLSNVTPSRYLNENLSCDEKELLMNKIKFLNNLLDNKEPISPYSGISAITCTVLMSYIFIECVPGNIFKLVFFKNFLIILRGWLGVNFSKLRFGYEKTFGLWAFHLGRLFNLTTQLNSTIHNSTS